MNSITSFLVSEEQLIIQQITRNVVRLFRGIPLPKVGRLEGRGGVPESAMNIRPSCRIQGCGADGWFGKL